jgi:inosine-uridine nucleoside N-ribohydrolase
MSTTRDDRWYDERLAEPQGPVRLVIDTDAANEIDDQFAIAWALLRPQQLRIEGLHAAPFSFAHRRADLPHAPADAPSFCTPGDGMRRSLDEIRRILALLGLPDAGRVHAGSARYLGADGQPVASAAVDHLIALARSLPRGERLWVAALGAPTNVASALLLAPDLVERIVVVWTSAWPTHAPHANASFNFEQDVAASRILFDSGVPLVYLPGFHVGAQLRLSRAEADRHVAGRGAIGAALHALFVHNPLFALYPTDAGRPYSWTIWDLICIAWLLEPRWVPSHLVRAPHVGDDLRWQPGSTQRHRIREGYGVDRDAIFNDLFDALATTRPA